MPRNGSGVASQPTSTAAVSGDTISSTKFNSIMADIYSLFNTAWPLSLSQNLAALGGQPLNVNLTSISSLGTAADKIAYTTAAGTWAETAFPAWARTFNGSADIATARTNLGAQTADAALTSIADLTYSQGALLYATAADTFAVLSKGTAAQVLAMNAGGTAPEWKTIFTFSDSYSSPQTVISAATWQAFTHGLGAVPKVVSVAIRCISADAGYSVSDEIQISTYDAPGAASPTVMANATTVNLYVSGSLRVPNGTTGALTGITLTSWRWIVRAYA